MGAQSEDELMLHEMMRLASYGNIWSSLVLMGIFGCITAASFISSSRVLESSGVQRSSTCVYFPDFSFDAFIVSSDLYGLIGFLGKKAIYSGAFRAGERGGGHVYCLRGADSSSPQIPAHHRTRGNVDV